MEYLTSGITAVFDMYMFRADGAKAMRECGFRNVFCESINNFGGTLEQVEADYHTYNQDALVYPASWHHPVHVPYPDDISRK